jgi:hypothetical protein
MVLMVIFHVSAVGSATGAETDEPGQAQLRMVTIEAETYGQVRQLAAMGLDITQGYVVEAVVSAFDEKKLGSEGFSWSEVPGRGPAHKVGSPYDVYKSYDEPVTGIKAQLRRIHAAYPELTQLKTIGRSVQKRPILAMRITNEKSGQDKPQVLYLTTHHAREWVATQMGMRLINYLTEKYGASARVTDLLDSVEIWVVPVANPDGYQYTFTNERLWRKNLRDNDGDGQITLLDGVDLNRNFATHWGYDNEGSSPSWQDATYRGPAPNSEPETQAVVDFIESKDFKYAISYHTAGNLILYPEGWQVSTPSLDDPIFVAQAGTDAIPAIWDSINDVGYNPGVGADLYVTNGDFEDWAYTEARVPTYVVELTLGYGFEFPDDEALVQTVFEDNLEFALSLAESALDPAHPVSPVGIPAQDVYHTPVTDSYGPGQVIEVLARKDLTLSVDYTINGGSTLSAGFTEELGERYNDVSGIYYSKYQAVIPGQQAGDSVLYQINFDGTALGPYGYAVTSATGNPILLVAAEDYSGTNPDYGDPTQANYLHFYTDALDAGGYAYDVWDVDAQGIPTYAEVLSHYEAVIWYTGDDYIARVPAGLDTQQLEVLNFRDFLNYDDGKLLATGQDLAWLAATAHFYSDDFFQYYLGANIDLDNGGIDLDTNLPFGVRGETGDPVFDGLTFGLDNSGGGDGADNQCCSSTFLPTSYFLPHFDDVLAARYDRPGGPFDPHSGDYYVYSQLADVAYKRLGGTYSLPTGAPTLKFWTSYDIETDWDYAFVEVSAVGSGAWTTLPDLNGLSTTATGESCTAGWVDQLHPFLANYMDAACNPTGATGSWNGFTGNSGGWQQVEVDLSAYAGQDVELYITYATDWATQGLGVFVDDIELSGYPLEDFETGWGLWFAGTAPGSSAFNNWTRIPSAGFPEGPAIRTPDTVYLGFGFEAIDTAANRAAVMERMMTYLGR